MRKTIKPRGKFGTGCVVLTKEELRDNNARIGDIINIIDFTIIRRKIKNFERVRLVDEAYMDKHYSKKVLK